MKRWSAIIDNIHKNLSRYESLGKKIFATSSFQTQSLPLLHIISQCPLDIPVVFLDTGFHFPETLVFRDQVADLLQLRMINLKPIVSHHLQKDMMGRFFYASDPDYCCYLNKIQAFDIFVRNYDVWVTGVRASQGGVRETMGEEETAVHGIKRYHPLIGWSEEDLENYMSEFSLPRHPLTDQGYGSIGCEPCTSRSVGNSERSGRWAGQTRTECGLHTEMREGK